MKLRQILLPISCLLCHGRAEKHDLCSACKQDLPWLENVCQRCAVPLGNETQAHCGRCQKMPPYYDSSVVLFEYVEPINHMLNKFKFHHQLCYGNLFGNLLAERLACHNIPLPELVIPVPLHPARLRVRGYNQALELARPLAKILKLKLNYSALIRRHNTAQQSLLAKTQRYANVQGAFQLIRPLTARYVALLDDVITTGSTINACSKILKAGGVENIAVLAIAKTNLS